MQLYSYRQTCIHVFQKQGVRLAVAHSPIAIGKFGRNKIDNFVGVPRKKSAGQGLSFKANSPVGSGPHDVNWYASHSRCHFVYLDQLHYHHVCWILRFPFPHSYPHEWYMMITHFYNIFFETLQHTIYIPINPYRILIKIQLSSDT